MYDYREAVKSDIMDYIREFKASGATKGGICEMLGVSPATVYRYTRETAPVAKICPHCGETLPHNAKFCFMCGERLKTPREKLIDRVNAAMRNFNLLPEAARDSTMATMRDVISFLSALED